MINDLYLTNNTNINMKIPVPPENYIVESPQENIEANLYKFGTTVIDSRPGFRKVSLSSFFTDKDYSFRRDTTLNAFECVEIIESLKKTRDRFNIVITGTNIGTDTEFLALVDDFNYNTTPSGDIQFSLTISETRRI